MKDLQEKTRKVLAGWPQELIPENLEELIAGLYDTDNRKVGRLARKEEDRGEFSFGLFKAVKKTIQEKNRLDQTPARSYQETRIDRIGFVQTSDGRKPRRWGR